MIADLLDEMAEQRLKEELLAYVLLLMHGEPFVGIRFGSLCPWPKSCARCWPRFVCLAQRAPLVTGNVTGILLQTCCSFQRCSWLSKLRPI